MCPLMRHTTFTGFARCAYRNARRMEKLLPKVTEVRTALGVARAPRHKRTRDASTAETRKLADLFRRAGIDVQNPAREIGPAEPAIAEELAIYLSLL